MWEYNYTPAEDELYHFGVKGMKWGVRRYQNSDGSLTAKGKKRYDKMSDDKLYKTLNKQVKKQRGQLHGKSNRWMNNTNIGKESESVLKKFSEEDKKYKQSKEYQKLLKKAKDVDKKWNLVEQGKLSEKEWTKEHDKAYAPFEKRSFDVHGSYHVAGNGREYTNAYINGRGKEKTIAYLKDLGYDDKTSNDFYKRLSKSKKKVIN